MVGNFRAQNFQKSLKCHDLPRKWFHFKPLTPIHPHRRIQGGPGGHGPPRPFELYYFFCELFCWRFWRCLAKLAYWLMWISRKISECVVRIGPACGKFLLLPPPPPRKTSATTPPPLNRAGFWRQRKFLLLPPPQSVGVPLLDYPLWIRPWPGKGSFGNTGREGRRRKVGVRELEGRKVGGVRREEGRREGGGREEGRED